MDPIQPTELDKFLFDLNGYLVVKNAVSPADIDELNGALDAIPRLKPGEWFGYVHGHNYGTKDGLNYQQIYEGGEPFERLIDHPSWIERVKCFVGGEGDFDYHHGPLFIDENFANFRGPGEAIGLHSGGHRAVKRCQFRFHAGHFMCGQVNMILALTDIGPGDGATMVIPASHKSNIGHPHFAEHGMKYNAVSSVDGIIGAVEVHLQKGDALLFVDAICHGSAKRINPGERRIIIYRYGPSWGNFRHGYQPSPELLARLTPERRRIVWPQNTIPRVPQVKAPARELASVS